MQAGSPIADIARVIQLSIAPVFLISGIAALLSVLSGRLARLVDRSRVLEASLPAAEGVKLTRIQEELSILARRDLCGVSSICRKTKSRCSPLIAKGR